jgi:hypothetical protein
VSDLNARFEFTFRSTRDADVIRVGTSRSATVAFGNVRRNRHGGSTQLRSEAMSLFRGKLTARGVTHLDQVHSLVPYLEIAKARDDAHVVMDRTNSADSNQECFREKAPEVSKCLQGIA